jgi:hypothetical protein
MSLRIRSSSSTGYVILSTSRHVIKLKLPRSGSDYCNPIHVSSVSELWRESKCTETIELLVHQLISYKIQCRTVIKSEVGEWQEERNETK